MSSRKTYYEILGLTVQASTEQVRSAFRRLALERHPDRFRGANRDVAEREFQAITEAYNVLVDPSQRARYDQQLENNQREVLTNPKDVAKALLAKAVGYVKQNQYLEAEQYFSQAIAHDGQSARAHQLYGLFLAQQLNRVEQGLRHLDQAVKLAPDDARVLLDASKTFARGRMIARAVRLAKQAAQLDPGDPAIDAWLQELQSQSVRG
jgi:curved DNA-binding protein CbpA